ncbi:MAG: phosphoribosylamine--glycine ligase [Pseudomonadota bacterium]
MRVLIIGSGGREHALAWKVAQSDRIDAVYVAPGNGGTHLEPKTHNVDIAANDIAGLLDFAREQDIHLTIVGPEEPLVLGIVDEFSQAGLRCFGPKRRAAQLEGSKAFTKDFLNRYNIPTAAYATFSDSAAAIEYVRQQGAPIVVKADGLAAGKGVVVAETVDQAEHAIRDMLDQHSFGEASTRIVVEEFLQGEEASFIVMASGRQVLPLATSQDHKARDNGDLGPNTGGMGAYSPAPVITPTLHKRVMDEIVHPTLAGLEQDGTPYLGFLYAGLMIDSNGNPKVLEYNCRFGDPETQPIMMRLESDLAELCIAAIEGRLYESDATWATQTALGVVMAAGGYPQTYEKNKPISGLPQQATSNLKVFHAGTKISEDQILTDGGRVLCVVALAENTQTAQTEAYHLVREIRWDDVYYRTDIGYRAIRRG